MMFLLEGIPDILLFRGFLETSFKGKVKWIGLYPIALIALLAWWLYTKCIHLYFLIDDRKSKR